MHVVSQNISQQVLRQCYLAYLSLDLCQVGMICMEMVGLSLWKTRTGIQGSSVNRYARVDKHFEAWLNNLKHGLTCFASHTS